MRPVKNSVSNSRRQALWRFAIKAAVTAAIFAFLFSKIDVRSFGEALAGANTVWLALAWVGYSSLYITTVFKWNGLLVGLGVSTSKWMLLRLDAIGRFASAFLPGTVGGDVLRWRLAGPVSGGYMNVAASILVQRFTGVIGCVVLAVVAVLSNLSLFASEVAVLVLVGGSVLLLVLTAIVVSNRRWASGLAYRTRRLRIRRLVAIAYRLHRILQSFPRGALWLAVGWSVIFYTGAGAVLYFASHAVDARIAFGDAIASVAIVSLLTMIPISVGGLGVKQAGDVYLLQLFNVDPTIGLAASLIKQIVAYSYSMLGGVLFILWKAEAQTEITHEEPVLEHD